jgi:tripeptide aminopeptidase
LNLSLVNRVLKMAIAIQQIPAPTFNEGKRATFIRDRFIDEGLVDVEIDAFGNVFARLPGRENAQPLVVSAHIDTVFPQCVDLKISQDEKTIQGPGIGDNALGVAGLFGLLWELGRYKKQAQKLKSIGVKHGEEKLLESILPGDVWLVANVGEEGLGNLYGMRAVVERFSAEPRAYIVLEGLALGQIFHQGLGVRRYRIVTQTPGGHSWVDRGKPSAIHELARLVTCLAAIPLSSHPHTSLNVGVISGGTSVNTIASEARLELDLRSEDGKLLADLIERVEKLVGEANHGKVSVNAKVIGQRPFGELHRQHPLVQNAVRALKEVGVKPSLNIGSTDANIPLSQGLPAISVGITTGGGAHTLDEYINISPVSKGLDQLVKLVHYVFEQN